MKLRDDLPEVGHLSISVVAGVGADTVFLDSKFGV